MNSQGTSPSITGKRVAGIFDTLFKRFRLITQISSILTLYLLGCLCIGVSMAPGFWLFHYVTQAISAWGKWSQWVVQGSTLALCYFLYGIVLILIVPMVNWIFRVRLKRWRGSFYSAEGLRWYFHNGLTYLVRYTFLPIVTPTPLTNLFYLLMGMKLGKDVLINSEYISDPCLIELGDHVVVGGAATIIAHYAVGGFLITAPVKIGKGVTIGLRATIMAGVQIGEKAKILPNSVVLPNTHIPAGETWGGVPAERFLIKPRRRSRDTQ
ncbi:MAG: DapH/DapD/GlmU-related protein [Bdellovibrionia bacterium]